MTEHEAILKLKDITQVFQAEDREEVDNMFYNQLTLDDIMAHGIVRVADKLIFIRQIRKTIAQNADKRLSGINKA